MREIMLIVHFIGLAMGIGTGFAFMFLGIAGSRMEKHEGLKFSINSLVLSKMGHIGLGLLILSGVFLIVPYWSVLFTNLFLLIKLALVLALAVVIGVLSKYGRKARTSANADMYLKKMESLGKVSILLGLSIVVLAVLAFR